MNERQLKDLGLKSVPRNPLLFGIFQRMGLVEQIGSGIRRIRQMCRDYVVADPNIEVSESWVITIFRRPVSNSGISMPEIRPQQSRHCRKNQ